MYSKRLRRAAGADGLSGSGRAWPARGDQAARYPVGIGSESPSSKSSVTVSSGSTR